MRCMPCVPTVRPRDCAAGAYIALHALQRLEQAATSPQAADAAARQPQILKVSHRLGLVILQAHYMHKLRSRFAAHAVVS